MALIPPSLVPFVRRLVLREVLFPREDKKMLLNAQNQWAEGTDLGEIFIFHLAT